MKDTKQLLETRTKMKKAKPTFVVKESKFSARVKSRWRFPRGKHSGSRQYHKGKPLLPTPGYGSPKAVKHLHKSGKENVLIKNANELKALNADTQVATIAKIGKKKLFELLNIAKEIKVFVTNVKDVDQKIEKIDTDFAARKKKRQAKVSEKSKKEVEKKKRAEEKKKKEEEEKASKEKPEGKEASKKEIVEEQKKTIEKEIIKKQ